MIFEPVFFTTLEKPVFFTTLEKSQSKSGLPIQKPSSQYFFFLIHIHRLLLYNFIHYKLRI